MHARNDVGCAGLQSCTEDFLKESGLDYTILRLCGFHQAIIGNYAVPILEEKPVWGTNDDTRTAYLDTVDISRMVMAAIRAPGASNASLTLAGPKAWTTSEVCPVLCAVLCRGAAASSLVTRVMTRHAGRADCRLPIAYPGKNHAV